MKYQVTLTVTFEQTSEVEADSEADAAKFAYDNFDSSEAETIDLHVDVCEAEQA